MATIIVLLIIVAIVAFAIRNIKKHGSCSCGCDSCPSSSTCSPKNK